MHILSSLHLVLIFTVFLVSQPSHADEAVITDVERAHLIIAADHSGSMHNTRAIKLQAEAIITALHEYTAGCSNTTITYFAWGGGVRQPISVNTSNVEDMYSLMLAIRELSLVNLVGSDHKLGFATAQSLVVPEERTIVILLTDDKASAHNIEGISFELHKVAIMRPGVAETLRTYFLPGVGTVHEVTTVSELETLMKDLLEAARTALCLS